MKKNILYLYLAALFLALPASTLSALEKIIHVTNDECEGPGSLRAAIAEAEASSEEDIRIVFDSDMYIYAPDNDDNPLAINRGLTIDGNGHNIIIDSYDYWRVFTIGYANEIKTPVVLKNLTLIAGFPYYKEEEQTLGGAILVKDAELHLDKVVFKQSTYLDESYCYYTFGAAIYSYGLKPLRINDCTFSNMRAGGNGVIGIEDRNWGQTTGHYVVEISGKTIFKDNILLDNGGALFMKGGKLTELTITGEVEFNNNTSKDGNGGAIAIEGQEVDIKLDNVIFSMNKVKYHGGAISINAEDGKLIVANSTFTGNGSTDGHGGAIDYQNIACEIRGSQFFSNTVKTEGGGAIQGNLNKDKKTVWPLIIDGCRFEGNEAVSHGAAVSFTASNQTRQQKAQINNTTFEKNQMNERQGSDTFNSSSGSAVSLQANNGASIESEFLDTDFIGNIGWGGGAVELYYPMNAIPGMSPPSTAVFRGKFIGNTSKSGGAALGTHNFAITILKGSEFTGNIADNWPNREGNAPGENNISGGGALWIQHAFPLDYLIEEDVTFSNNQSGGHGGAIFLKMSGGGSFKSYADFKENKAYHKGGAIWVQDVADVQILKGQFAGNKAGYEAENTPLRDGGDGGAISLNGSHTKAIIVDQSDDRSDMFFQNNSAYRGGAISGDKITGLQITADFDQNSSEDNGGAIWTNELQGDGINIYKGHYTANTAGQSGGAIYLNNRSWATIKGDKLVEGNPGASDLLFQNNKAMNHSGGAIATYAEGKLTLSRAYLIGNTTNGTGEAGNMGGGAIYNGRCELDLSYSILENNESKTTYGGALFNVNNVNGGKAESQVTNVLFLNNSGSRGTVTNHPRSGGPAELTLTNTTIIGSNGSGVYTWLGDTKIQNSIIWGWGENSLSNNSVKSYKGDNSLIQNVEDDTDGNIPGTAKNTPLFLGDQSYYDPATMPYYGLAAGSPGVDGGKDSYFTEVIKDKDATDLWGSARFNNTIDMGAYEQAATVSFINDVLMCEGSSGSLQLKLTGQATWIVTYKKEGGEEKPVTISADNVRQTEIEGKIYYLYTLSGLAPGKYILISVGTGKNGETEGLLGERTEATLSTVSNPQVAAISGPSEVYVGESIKLSNATSGGIWMVDKENIASINLKGELTGLAEGSVEVWYVVTGSAPTNCETIVRYTVTVKNKGPGPDPEDPDPEDPDPEEPDPDPEWPPVVPEPPVDPDPDPDAWIVIQAGEACFTEELFNLFFHLQYTGKPLRYAVAFTEKSKAAGFEDVKTYKDLPEDGIITITIPKGVKPGNYSGYILVSEKGSAEYRMYLFTVTIKDGVTITRQPQAVTEQAEGEKFTLSVEAVGDNLTYQWFYNGERIEGATSATYETIYDASKEGLYHVEVYGDCGWLQSYEVMITGCFALLMKWDDVLYVQNTDDRYARFQWYRDGQAITEWGSSIYYTEPVYGLTGSYYVRAYQEDGKYIQSCPMHFERIRIELKWENVLTATSRESGYVKYQWYKDGQAVNAGGEQEYYSDPEGLSGSYFIRAYFADGSYHESKRLLFGEVSTRSLTSVSVYPTVVERSHYINVESDEQGDSYIGGMVELYNLSGGKVYAQRLLTPQFQIPVNQPAGVYLLQVSAPDGRRKTEKIVVR